MDWTRWWITCSGMAIHSCLSAWDNSCMIAGAFTLPQTRLSNSSYMCLIRFKSGDMEGQGEFEHCCRQRTVWCGFLHGVWYCRVEIQRHTTSGAQNKTAKEYSNFEQYNLSCFQRSTGTVQNPKEFGIRDHAANTIANTTVISRMIWRERILFVRRARKPPTEATVSPKHCCRDCYWRRKSVHIIPILCELHWLPVDRYTDHKIMAFEYRCAEWRRSSTYAFSVRNISSTSKTSTMSS